MEATIAIIAEGISRRYKSKYRFAFKEVTVISKGKRILLDLLFVVAFVSWGLFAFAIPHSTFMWMSMCFLWAVWGIQKKVGMI